MNERRPSSLYSLDDTVDHAAQSYLRWVRTGIRIAVVGYAVMVGMSLVTGDVDDALRQRTDIPALIVAILGLWTVERGRIRTGGLMVLVGMWLELHASLVLQGSLRTYVGIPIFPVLIVGTGLFLGGPWAIGLGLVTSITAPACVWLSEALGIVSRSPAPGVEPRSAIVLGFATFSTGILVHLGLKTFGEVLVTAQANERRFAGMFENAAEGMVLIDDRGTIEEINASAATLFGRLAGDWIRRPWSELLGDLGIDPADFEERLGEGSNIPRPLEVRRPDGNTIQTEATSQQVWSGGESVSLLVVLRDVMAKRTAEERARQLAQILENARTEIFLIGLDPFELLMVSRGALDNIGVDTDEVIGAAPTQVMPGLSESMAQRLVDTFQELDAHIYSMTGLHRRKNGSAYPTEWWIQAGQLEGRSVLTVFAVDTTQRVEAQAEQENLRTQLQHAQKMDAVGALAGGVAHDFNNLLTIIGGCAEILAEEVEPDSADLVSEIRSAHDKGATLTRKLLAFARKDVVQPSVLPVDDAVRETLPLVDTLVGEQIHVSAEIEPCGRILADPGQIEQILLNLAANARDAMPQGGRLTVTVEPDPTSPDSARIRVQDDGVGMEADTAERVFDPFFTTKPRGKGTGLGLSTVHGIVTQNGGTVTIESTPGEGTGVVIRWPLTHRTGDPEPSTASARPGADPTDSDILVVEDNDGARKVVRLYLERAGYRVHTAADGAEALRVLRDPGTPVDLLLTDVIMPGMSGLDLAETIREERPHLPVLFMSGYMDDVFEELTEEAAPPSILLKPFTSEDLLERVATVLEHARNSPESPGTSD